MINVRLRGRLILLFLLFCGHLHNLMNRDLGVLRLFLQQALFLFLVLHVERLYFEELLDLRGQIYDQVVLEFLLHELRDRAGKLGILGGDPLLVLMFIVKHLNKLTLSLIKSLLR